MREVIQKTTKTCYTFEEVYGAVIQAFGKVMEQSPGIQIGYVAGIIKADGSEHIETNRKTLMKFTEDTRRNMDFPIFSATDVFSDDVYTRLGGLESIEAGNHDFRKFWRDILKAGYITDIFMTPRWEQSGGATDEHNTALTLKLHIHYLDKNNF